MRLAVFLFSCSQLRFFSIQASQLQFHKYEKEKSRKGGIGLEGEIVEKRLRSERRNDGERKRRGRGRGRKKRWEKESKA